MIADYFSLQGKKALVTGSGRGIGRAIAFALGTAGAKVYFHATGFNDTLKNTVREAKEAGIDCEAIAGDLADDARIECMIAEIAAVDILVLNASIQKYQPLAEFNEQDFIAQFKVNLASSFKLIQAFLPAMQKNKWGRVLAVGSVNQWKQSPRLPVYAASKSALSNLIMNCARAYGADGVTFNNLAPGIIVTDRNRQTLSDPEKVEKFLTEIPLKRFGMPEDCAPLALLLCSDAGAYITGADIPVTGGMHL